MQYDATQLSHKISNCYVTLGAFFWDYSGIGLLGIDGIRVLL